MSERIYKTELHTHTCEISKCANQTAAQLAEKYIAEGYSTLVVTNHFKYGNTPGDTWHEQVDNFFDATDLVRKAAGDSLFVLDGMEIRFRTLRKNEYLVFGAYREAFYDIPDVFDWSYSRFFEYAKAHGMMMVQAHPFRFGMTLVDPGFLRGIEVFNGHPGENSHNSAALAWLKHFQEKKDLFPTSGSDNHFVDQKPNGGIKTSYVIRTNDQLLDTLWTRDYELISDEIGPREGMGGFRLENRFL